MTLLLKSTARATNSLGNVHGNIGPSDYVAMLDFARDEYFTNIGGVRTDYPLEDTVEVSRSSPGPYVLRDGVRRSAPANQPRRHFIEPLDTEGLLLLTARQNLAANANNGAAITIPAAATNQYILVSWSGGGDATLTGTGLTFHSDMSEAGRKIRAYTRASGVINATLNVTGSVADVQVEIGQGGNYATPFMGYATSVANETMKLKAPFKGLLAGGSGTVLSRFVLAPGPVTTHSASFISIMSASPLGGIHAQCSRALGGPGTDHCQTVPDGGVFGSQTNRAHCVGTGRRAFTMGLRFTGRGNTADILSYGQLAKSSGNGTLFGAPTDIHIGGLGGPTGFSGFAGGIVTHTIIWDYAISDDDALAVANQWL